MSERRCYRNNVAEAFLTSALSITFHAHDGFALQCQHMTWWGLNEVSKYIVDRVEGKPEENRTELRLWGVYQSPTK